MADAEKEAAWPALGGGRQARAQKACSQNFSDRSRRAVFGNTLHLPQDHNDLTERYLQGALAEVSEVLGS